MKGRDCPALGKRGVGMAMPVLLALLWAGLWHAGSAMGQGTGLINLMPPIPASAVAPASASGPAAAGGAGDKAILSGAVVSLALSVEEPATQRIHAQIAKPFPRKDRAQVLSAARAVQRDVKLACRRLCTSGKMSAPQFSADGHLSFEMVVVGFARTLSQSDLVAVLEARPLNKTGPPPAQPVTPGHNASAAQ